MDLTKYVNNLSLSGELLEKLNQRVFLKTELDIVYSDFTNWERADLISIGEKVEKGKWKHLSYSEYVWVKIVEQLRTYGFSYSEILSLKNQLQAYIPGAILIKKALKSKKELDEIDPEISIALEANKDNLEFIKLFDNHSTYLDDFIVNAISYQHQTSILFFKDSPGEYSHLSKKMLEVSEEKKFLDELIKYNSRTHLSVSINMIISKFIRTDEANFLMDKPALLSREEYALLKIIRNKPDDVKKISVRFNDKEIDLIEIESIKKKVELESRLMDHIKKGDYTTMEITSQNGHVSHVKNIKKVKL